MPDISTGIIDSVLHPPLGFLKPNLDKRGPYTGNQTLTQWSSTLGPIYTYHPFNQTAGLVVMPGGLIPEPYGYDVGWVSPEGAGAEVYHNRLCQIVVQHQLLGDGFFGSGGAWVTSQLIDVHMFPTLVLWDVALPGRIGLLTAPGLEIDLYVLLLNP